MVSWKPSQVNSVSAVSGPETIRWKRAASAEYFENRCDRLDDPEDPYNMESFWRERKHAKLLGHRLVFERSHWKLRKHLLSS